MDYPTGNRAAFAIAVDEVKDRRELIELKKAIESVKQYYNIASLLGYKELMDQIDIKLISTFLNIISRRLINLSAMERPDDFSSQALLNLAI